MTKNLRGCISIFVLPQEIDDLHLTLYNLKRNSVHVKGCDFTVDITLNMSNALTDWEGSNLARADVEEKFESIIRYIDWATPNCQVDYGEKIMGCVSQRRQSFISPHRSDHMGYDFYIWLDPDLFFGDHTLMYMVQGAEVLREDNVENYIVTPQFVRQWDSTWDMLVHRDYLDKPLMYHEKTDIIKDCLSTPPEIIGLKQAPDFKFAGGWFTMLSESLLTKIGIPDALGHYGLEDTFICEAARIWKQWEPNNVQQFTLTGVLVGENYTHRHNDHLLSGIRRISHKEEFARVARSAFTTELVRFSKEFE